MACGFHAGDPATMRRVAGRAVALGVRVGAQVGYRDLAGFGRRDIDVAPDELCAEVMYQYGALAAFAPVAYVKPHGALYNRVVHDERQAAAVVEAVAAVHPGCPVLTLPGSVLARLAASAGLHPVAEAYPDRGYRSDGTLVPRSQPGALVTGAAAVAERAVRLATEGTVAAVDGPDVGVRPASLCLHGDSPGAAATARAVRAALESADVALQPFA